MQTAGGQFKLVQKTFWSENAVSLFNTVRPYLAAFQLYSQLRIYIKMSA